MKKIISFLASVSLLASVATVASAADRDARQPDVNVNGTEVEFVDQKAYITDEGRTLVPARGVFEAMGCTVGWNADTYEVTVAKDDKTVVLKIDSDVMKVTQADETKDVTLEVPAQIMNDRTMVPLRAISEAFDSIVSWSESQYAVYINIGNQSLMDNAPNLMEILSIIADNEAALKKEINEEDKIKISLYTDAKEVKSGDEFDVYVKLDGKVDDFSLVGMAVTLNYDKELLSYVEESGTLTRADDKDVAIMVKNENTEYASGTKNAYVCSVPVKMSELENYVYKATFKKLTDNPATISVGAGYDEITSYETALVVNDAEGNRLNYEGDWLTIDTTPIGIK